MPIAYFAQDNLPRFKHFEDIARHTAIREAVPHEIEIGYSYRISFRDGEKRPCVLCPLCSPGPKTGIKSSYLQQAFPPYQYRAAPAHEIEQNEQWVNVPLIGWEVWAFYNRSIGIDLSVPAVDYTSVGAPALHDLHLLRNLFTVPEVIRVEESNVIALRRRDPRIPGDSDASIRLMYQSHSLVASSTLTHDAGGGVRRPIINHDDLN
nr:hypothetical protein [Mesorhizobium sp.]